jgi:hypothetical protein
VTLVPVSAPDTQTGFARTDAAGAYRLSSVRLGQYHVRFALPGGAMVQFHPQQTDVTAAAIITVDSGRDTVVDEIVLPHGALAGRLTLSSGQPVADAVVGIERLDGSPAGGAMTDGNGDYQVPFLPAGTYHVYFHQNRGGSMQWAHQRRSRADADPIAVPNGTATRLDLRFLPLGTIAGRLLGRDGPVIGAAVFVFSQTNPDELVVSSHVNVDGSFDVPVFPGRYKVAFRPPGSETDQWARGTVSEDQATVFPVAAGRTVFIEEFLLPTGRMRGRLTDAGGAPVVGASVQLHDPAGQTITTFTGDDGTWTAHPDAGTYRVRFSAPDQGQWATDKLTRETANRFTLAPGQTITVNESLLPTGSLVVRATDAQTGVPIATFCATATNEFLFRDACTNDGSVEFPSIGAGTYTVTVSDGVRLDTVTTGVRVVPGRTTTITSRLRFGGTIVIRAVDASTGQPVENVCVNLIPAAGPHLPAENHGACDVAATLTVSRVRLGQYQIFATTFDGVHGSQWIGSDGGVGSQAQARVVTATSGGIVRLTVRLDGRGSIGGLITDRATGTPVAGAMASVWGTATVSDADGRYVLDGLGPYRWTVFFVRESYGGQWSGGGTNRPAAEPIPVLIDQTTPYDVALSRGTTLTGRLTGPGGGRPDFAQITVYNARTFDVMGWTSMRSDGTYSVQLLGPQEVKLYVQAGVDGRAVNRWYDNAADFARGRSVGIPSTGTRTLDIAIG